MTRFADTSHPDEAFDLNDDLISRVKGILKRKKENKTEKAEASMVPFLSLFRFSNNVDKIMMIIGSLGAAGNGVMLPLMLVVFTGILDDFTSFGNSLCTNSTLNLTNDLTNNLTDTLNQNLTKLQENFTVDFMSSFPLMDSMRTQAIYLLIIGIATTILSYFQVAFWMMPAEKQARKLRRSLLESILKQEIGWFDVYKSGELNSRLTEDINKIKDGIGEKFGNGIQYFTTFLVSLIISFTKGWKLTLVILSLSPLLFISSALFTKLTSVLATNELKSYAIAGSIAEEVFTAIRTVFAFNGAQKEHKRYSSKLDDARKFGIKKGFVNGFMMGFLWLVVNCSYALGFWYGWSLTEERDPITGIPKYSIGTILIVFFCILTGIFSLGNSAPLAGTLAMARAAAFEIFKIIDRVPQIDSSSSKGDKPSGLIGNVKFNDVNFSYPARPETKILNGLSLEIKSGTICALVGGSGCGKSTCLQLLQRFYDPIEGSVFIDNRNIKDYNIKWLRTNIGVVNQEPILFGTSIKDNIRFGKEDATDDEIILAAKNANAHDFIMTLPDKYDTLVGDRGGQLSGGQKQRVAIARALVRNPKILLLDEATSALDNQSESIVQAALDRASRGRTTIIVAHRLSTIINADVIFVLDSGKVAEIGTHNELMERKGIYHQLVINQQSNSDGEKKAERNDKFENIDLNNDEIDVKKIMNTDTKTSEVKNEKVNKGILAKIFKKKEADKEKKENVSMLKVFDLNKPELLYIIFGSIASIVSGATQPVFSIILSKAIGVFSLCTYEERKNQIIIFSVLFIVFGFITFFSNIIQSGMFGYSGENLTKRLRSKGFETMLKQEIGWFDDKKNNVGTLTTKLAVEAATVQGATGVRLGFLLMNLGNLGVGMILSFVFSWPITLCILGFTPFIVISGIFQTKMLSGFSNKDKEVLEEAGRITNESISNIRTVAILHKEQYFIDKYYAKISVPYKAALKSANFNGFMLGFSASIMYYAIAAAFSLGAYLVANNLFGMTLERIMLVFGCVMFGAQSVGQASAMMPDYAKAQSSINSMFELFERVPKINNWESGKGDKLNENEYKADVKLSSVEFTYPSRPDAKILKSINININNGEKVAFVGSSGCGKSTITQLLERFYDPDNGIVTLDNKDIRQLDLYWLRSQIGIVSQEPILFDMSIAENIAYGDNSREVPMNEIMEAAKKANIHDFISKLPEGYNTNVGSKGTQLSGGQKQRIAIARALVRNPKILLLDEATSALDTESEKVVQEALEKAQEGRTCIVIAHRLSTIRDSDVIFVLQDGVVTEKGSHDELIELNGFYAKLNGQHT